MKKTDQLAVTRWEFELSQINARKFRDLYDGLRLSGAKLKNGKFVERPRQAFEWILENMEPTSGA